MQEWKIKQEIYHRLNTEHTDDLNKVDIVITTNVKEDALRHFVEYVDEWIYPAKSYAVAYCYAHWISIDYNENFWNLLNDPMLPMTGMVPDIKEYYNAEIGSK